MKPHAWFRCHRDQSRSTVEYKCSKCGREVTVFRGPRSRKERLPSSKDKIYDQPSVLVCGIMLKRLDEDCDMEIITQVMTT